MQMLIWTDKWEISKFFPHFKQNNNEIFESIAGNLSKIYIQTTSKWSHFERSLVMFFIQFSGNIQFITMNKILNASIYKFTVNKSYLVLRMNEMR